MVTRNARNIRNMVLLGYPPSPISIAPPARGDRSCFWLWLDSGTPSYGGLARRRKRAFVVATRLFKLVDRLTELTRLPTPSVRYQQHKGASLPTL